MALTKAQKTVWRAVMNKNTLGTVPARSGFRMHLDGYVYAGHCQEIDAVKRFVDEGLMVVMTMHGTSYAIAARDEADWLELRWTKVPTLMVQGIPGSRTAWFTTEGKNARAAIGNEE